MYSLPKFFPLVFIFLLTLGCGGGSGGGDETGGGAPNPPTSPPPADEAPCNLTYPVSELFVQAGGSVSGFSPAVDCGIPDTYTVNPDLPLGMELAADTGVISGSPLEEIYIDTHTITATNGFGSTSFELTIDVRPLFEFTAESNPGSYSGLDGSGSLSVTAQLTEDALNPGFPDPVIGVNFSLAHPASMLNPVSFTYSPELEALNSGTGPMFVDVLMYPGEVVFYSIFSVTPSDYLDFAVPTSLVEINYETIPGPFVGSVGDVPVDFEWQDNSPETPTPNDLYITIETVEAFPANAVDFTATLQRID